MRTKSLLIFALVLAAALAGCADGGEGTEDTGDADGDQDDGGPSGVGNGTGDAAPALSNATLGADAANGTAPLAVNFTLDAQGADANTTWTLDFGDGNASNGTGLPATVAHMYNATGNFTAAFEATAGNSTAQATLNITVAGDDAPEAAPMPEKLTWEFGESLGCTPDAQATAGEPQYGCISLIAGPEPGDGIDGFWIELGEPYVGLDFTSTAENQRGDSDCVFLDADHGVIGEAHNSGGPCQGTVPSGTAWLFLYGYAEPTLSMTLTFEV